MKKPKGSKVSLPAYDSNGKVVEGYLVERDVDQLTPGEIKTYFVVYHARIGQATDADRGRYLCVE